MKQNLIFEKEGEQSSYRVSYNDGFVGHLYLDVDGFYYFWPDINSTGYWSDWELMEILTVLRQLNAKMDVDYNTSPYINPPLVLGQGNESTN